VSKEMLEGDVSTHWYALQLQPVPNTRTIMTTTHCRRFRTRTMEILILIFTYQL